MMKKAILARKEGMTQIYDETGKVIPVTVLKAGPCRVIFKRTLERDGYSAVQVGFEEKKLSRVNQPEEGHYKKAKVPPCRVLKEFRMDNADEFEVGAEIKSDIFSPGDLVDISGISKGKGFAGSVKRHGFKMGPRTHGSHHHRGPGSLGSVDLSRIFKGKKLPGRMGGRRSTILNLKVVSVDPAKNILLVKGSVPGPRGVLLEVREAVKKTS
jgi:large subunit ribosomal protein L3